MSRRIRVARCLVFALGVTLAAPALAGGNGVDLSGSVAASYFYNTNRPDSGSNSVGLGQPFHPSHNEFQLDQAVLDLSKDATDESKVGFRIRTVMGQLGGAQGGGTVDTGAGTFSVDAGGGNGIWLADAYVDYNCGGCGLSVRAGKFQTHIGYETAFADENVNITRGFTYNLLQPVDQIGLRLGTNVAGIDVMVGSVNGIVADQPDSDNSVDLIWSVGMSNDSMAISFNGQWDGNDEGGPGTEVILDGIVSIMPSDMLTAWIDVTHRRTYVDNAPDPDAIGVAVGSRLGINDKCGVAGRFEYLNADNGFNGIGDDDDFFAITVTGDYMLVQDLVAKLEVKWDHSADSDIFDGGDDDNRVLIGTQLVYTF